MLKQQRNLIIYQAQKFDTEIYDELIADNWDIYVANDLQQLADLSDNHTFKIGLYFVSQKCSNGKCVIGKTCLINKCKDTQQLAQINRLFNCHGENAINWIMCIPSECSPSVMLDAYESELVVEQGVTHINYPIDLDRLLCVLNNAYAISQPAYASQKYTKYYPSRFGIIGNSSVMDELFRRLEKISKEDCSVLIEGETGTGKELVANAIHKHSNRSAFPMVAINCGAFPKDLIQSELFGHEKGAFTGAVQRKIGRIEMAQGGTLFLDEIGDLPLEQQINLLRFLEDRVIERIGGLEKIAIDVRVIAATHVDLKAAIERKEFREDLYYRLQVLQITTPPLRLRENDRELLAYYFFNKFAENGSYKAKGLDEDAQYFLKNYNWPGNVRQLMNSIRHALVISENRLLTPGDLGIERRHKVRIMQTLEQARTLAERETIMMSLQKNHNNIQRSAEALNISPVTMYRLVSKYQLKAV